MRPLALVLLLLGPAAPLRAGQIEVPVGDLGGQSGQAGSVGGVLSAPVPLQLTVAPLTGQAAPTLGSALAAAPVPQPVATPAAARANVSAIPAIPALPEQAIPSAKSAVAAPKQTQTFEPVESAEAGTDEGRALFDQGGAAKPLGFNRGEGKVSDPALLPEKIYTPAIMREARASGRVFELDGKSLARLEPGVAHNFVIVEHRDGTIGMTVGRLNGVEEIGVKHAALGGGRKVLFSGTLRVDAKTGRPVLDFNSGVYSMAGLDARWAPTPQNARALAAHAEAILGGPVDVFDHIKGRPIDFRDEAPASNGLLARLRGLNPFGEKVPAWPGKTGDAVRIGRLNLVIGKHAGDGGTATVWRSRDDQFAIKILHPGARAVPGVEEEAATLRAIANSDLPVAKLLAESKDGSVQVKEFIDGETAYGLMGRGFQRQHVEGWSELAAMLIRSGITADLAPGNLVWQHWRSRWMIVDAGGLTDAGPAAVLKQMLTPEALKAGIDAGALLSGLRARLGPDSAKWKASRDALKTEPGLAPFRNSLASYDARLARAPVITFEPMAKASGGLDDSVVSSRELRKRLGYDPLSTKRRVKLHGEDPGKLNTDIVSIDEPGKAPMIVKKAAWGIIRDEAAARRIARRFFGRYFRVPASLAVNAKYDSYMVMEKISDASPGYGDAFNLEQRVAAALFIRTFGISDVNPGNVLPAHDRKSLPWLIDFEQAFGRASPSTGRHIPDERIALEKPWMSRFVHNRIEDYQPAIKAWREHFAEPENQTAVLADLTAAGYTPGEAAALLARFNLNAADLDWTLQNDADFVNQFVDRNAAQR